MRKSSFTTFGGVVTLKLVIASTTAIILAGCSDSVGRFADSYSNPSDKDPVYTASIQKPKHMPRYQAPELSSTSDAITQSPIANAAVAKAPVADYAYSYNKTFRKSESALSQADNAAPLYKRPKFAYNAPAETAPAYKTPKIDDTALPAENEKTPTSKPFKKKRGPKIMVADGMSLYDIARANKLTVIQLAEANGIEAPYTAKPGTELVIPGTMHPVLPKVAAAKSTAPAVADVATEDTATSGTAHIVTKGDTLFSLGRKYKVSAFAIADANGLPHDKSLALGRKLKIPTTNSAVVTKANTKDDGKTDLAAKSNKDLKVPNNDVADNALPDEPTADAKSAATTSDAQVAMRWPVRGRVISAYGSKPNGMKNEGINIMAPEGTNIQAADAGVVAYAGNELKGYGNLVLIRHAGGYVTAYAHAASLLVKKGDTVKRGDVIAKVGQTGAVQSPQLHFEVRRGATALDPSKFLNSATASK